MPQWKIEAHNLRKTLEVPVDYLPWTSGNMRKLVGLPRTARATEMLNLAAIVNLGTERALELSKLARTQACKGSSEMQSALQDVFVDVSQNPNRAPWTNASGVSKCLTTSSSWYSFSRDGMVLPLELMAFQGHRSSLNIPDSMSPSSLKQLAGQGICLPCLATLVLALAACGAFREDI